MRALFFLVMIAACSAANNKSEFKTAAPSPYGEASKDADLANSPLNNNINNTSAVHPYYNIYPSR